RVLPEVLPDIFIGQQMVVVGRYPKGGATKLTLTGRQGDKEVKYEYKVRLADGPSPDGRFIASLWAQRRIGELIDQIDMAGGKPSQELVDELVALSKKYGILTPYTSFLALENQAITRENELAPMVAENLSAMDMTVGEAANRQRSVKAKMKAGSFSSPMAPSLSKPEAVSQMADMASLDKQVARAQNHKLNLPNQWAGQTFYLKNGQWQAENMTDDDLKNLVTIKQLSDEYFELSEKLDAEKMIWLTQAEPVVFKFNGVNYLIEPAV
ncbi:hypothetical protein LJB99_04350, partial [Deltaproteobacteria bacterium OttesenSCG-928-K17]|nr:hypothetical protein [Deltaproteobacteria bacterium OttesenSCG-928-K17]